jgi:GNAT superfamily N-acetyltransferase
VVPGYLAPALLSADHNVDNFNCGKEPLDLFLKKHARQNERKGSSRTYVTCPESDPVRVVGYYSLVYASVLREKAPAAAQKGMPPKYEIPVMLLARLAVDAAYRPPAQKLGLGTALLKDALLKAVEAANIAGMRAMLVDAIDDEAMTWYRQFGFVSSPIEDLQLFLTMDQIRASVAGTVTAAAPSSSSSSSSSSC